VNISTVYELLAEHLAACSGLPSVQNENTRNIGKHDTPFVRGTVIPAKTQPKTLGINGRNELSGLFQVDIFVPKDAGVSQANALADLVLEHFPRGQTLTDGVDTILITISWRDVGRRDEPFYNAPVMVEWSSIS
jgi:hypothetical protein